MTAFGVFKGLYREAQNLNDIANQNGIKLGVKDQIRESADRTAAVAKTKLSAPTVIPASAGATFKTPEVAVNAEVATVPATAVTKSATDSNLVGSPAALLFMISTILFAQK